MPQFASRDVANVSWAMDAWLQDVAVESKMLQAMSCNSAVQRTGNEIRASRFVWSFHAIEGFFLKP